MPAVKSFDPQVISLLQEKIKLIKTDKGAIYLVGPIKLPVNLHGETVEFKWYCWLNCNEVTEDFERIVAKLSAANLAELQQSSVLVHGNFQYADHALVRFHSICHTGDIFGSKRCDCGYQHDFNLYNTLYSFIINEADSIIEYHACETKEAKHQHIICPYKEDKFKLIRKEEISHLPIRLAINFGFENEKRAAEKYLAGLKVFSFVK